METAHLIAVFAFLVTAFLYGLLMLLVWQKRVKAEKDWGLFTLAALAF
jgi:hypothetical protein